MAFLKDVHFCTGLAKECWLTQRNLPLYKPRNEIDVSVRVKSKNCSVSEKHPQNAIGILQTF